MRITGGTLSGRTVAAPNRAATRPTTDIVREALFAVLAHQGQLEGNRVLDLYAGSGMLAFEALSRGAASAVLVDSSADACRAARANADALGCSDAVTIMKADAVQALQRLPPHAAGIVFVDPPYAMRCCNAVLAALDQQNTVLPSGVVVMEHDDTEVLLPRSGWLHVATRRQGATVVDIMRRLPSSS